MELFYYWFDTIIKNRFFLSITLIIVIVFVRIAINKLIRNQQEILSTTQRLWISNINNVSYFIIFIGLIAIWSAALQAFIISATVLATALVIATKEVLLCLIGSIYRSSTRAFMIGDWIEINNIKGEVIDRSILATTLKEIYLKNNLYQYSGRTVTLPNSIFLVNAIKNDNFLKNYCFHEFNLTFDKAINPRVLEKPIFEIIETFTEDFREIAIRYMRVIKRNMATEFMDIKPKIRFTTTDFGHHVIWITFFCPIQDAIPIEQKIHKNIMTLYYGIIDKKGLTLSE